MCPASLYATRRQPSFAHVDRREGRVRACREAPATVALERHGVRSERANRAAVRDDDHPVGRPVTARDLADRVDHPLGHRRVRLAVVPARAAGDPARVPRGIPRRRLVRGQADPRPDIDLAEAGIELDLEPARLRDRLGGLTGPDQIGADECDRALDHQAARRRDGLRLAERRQRKIVLTLPAARPVPRGLAVSNEQEHRHRSGG